MRKTAGIDALEACFAGLATCGTPESAPVADGPPLAVKVDIVIGMSLGQSVLSYPLTVGRDDKAWVRGGDGCELFHERGDLLDHEVVQLRSSILVLGNRLQCDAGKTRRDMGVALLCLQHASGCQSSLGSRVTAVELVFWLRNCDESSS
jgi:hypothetical protein